MPTKRRTPLREHRITEAAVAAFKAGDEDALHHALALKPWEASPFASEDSEDLHGAGSAYSASLPQARALRQALEERARSPK